MLFVAQCPQVVLSGATHAADLLVGAAGLEPTTTGTPYRCATKLRHAPTQTR